MSSAKKGRKKKDRESDAAAPSIGTGNSKLEEVQRKADDVKGVMHKNIEMTLERGEKLEHMEEKAENLESHASMFQKNATKVKRMVSRSSSSSSNTTNSTQRGVMVASRWKQRRGERPAGSDCCLRMRFSICSCCLCCFIGCFFPAFAVLSSLSLAPLSLSLSAVLLAICEIDVAHLWHSRRTYTHTHTHTHTQTVAVASGSEWSVQPFAYLYVLTVRFSAR